MSTHRVSICTSVLNQSEFLERMIQSVIAQTMPDCELIIVDADSPESEAETIKRYLAGHKRVNYMRMNYRIAKEQFAPVYQTMTELVAEIAQIEQQLEQAGAPYTPGRMPKWDGK